MSPKGKQIPAINKSKNLEKFLDTSNAKWSSPELDFEEDKLTPEQEIEARMIDIFHNFDILGNYTNHKWFYNLHVYQLRDLYQKSEDMFNYRINLSTEEKKRYVKDGLAFKTNMSLIHKIKDKFELQNLILTEYEKFLSYDNNLSDKKTAIMWMLTSLTEVSDDARNAMPHLDQGMFGW